jgi:hypothetical protein
MRFPSGAVLDTCCYTLLLCDTTTAYHLVIVPARQSPILTALLCLTRTGPASQTAPHMRTSSTAMTGRASGSACTLDRVHLPTALSPDPLTIRGGQSPGGCLPLSDSHGSLLGRPLEAQQMASYAISYTRRANSLEQT